MAQAATNPSMGVPGPLLPHVHLVSTYKWPTLQSISLDTTVDMLLSAPRITRQSSAMAWTVLDSPPDGTVMLVWQPPSSNPQIAARFASDGYIWGDVERLFNQSYKGYNVEMFVHKIGYCPPEQMATHARRRYRLTPTNPHDTTSCDPSLWIVHYSQADPQDHRPSSSIPLHPQIQATLQQRRVLQHGGQIVRKEFMLGDHNNWPLINLPPGLQALQIQQQNQAMLPRGSVSGYPQGVDPSGAPTAKRQRQSGSMQRPTSSKTMLSMQDSALEDEKDSQDLFDLMTPREISSMRFTRHHEWMEELYSSPYATLDIIPVSLGLGRKGALASLTDGFVDAPSEASIKAAVEKSADPLDPAKSADFAKRATDKISSIKAEMEEMKRLHAKAMSKVTQGNSMRDAEKALRNATTSDAARADPWKLESGFRTLGSTNGIPTNSAFSRENNADIIARSVEAALNKRVDVLKGFICLDRGGLEEKAPPPPVPEPHEMEMVDDTANFDDFTTDIPDLPDTIISEATGPISGILPSGVSGTQMVASQPSAVGQPDAHDWVMVDKQSAGASVPGQAPIASTTAPANPEMAAATASQLSPAPAADLGADLVDFGDSAPDGEAFTTNEFDDQIDFSGLGTDTAGEAMEGLGGIGDATVFGDA